jgi:hypothetical protein
MTKPILGGILEEVIGTNGWNDDSAWIEYTSHFEPIIQAIATKYTGSESLREDCAQNARIALLTVWPSKIRGYELYVRGEIPEEEWNRILDAYCRNVIRNVVISTLASIRSGNPYVGRTRTVTDPETGKKRRVRTPERFVSLEDLQESGGFQIDQDGHTSWTVSDPFFSRDDDHA